MAIRAQVSELAIPAGMNAGQKAFLLIASEQAKAAAKAQTEADAAAAKVMAKAKAEADVRAAEADERAAAAALHGEVAMDETS